MPCIVKKNRPPSNLNTEDTTSHIRRTLSESADLIRGLSQYENAIRAGADLIRSTLLSSGKILTCGNGGSAADSSHLATEFACRFVADRRPYPAICLAGDSGLLTATANDYSFEEVFARQIAAFGRAGDVLVAITTSGKSENVRRALQAGSKMKLSTIALLGRDGGSCRGLADIEIVVRHGDTARIQEAHQVIIHLFCELVEPHLQRAPLANP